MRLDVNGTCSMWLLLGCPFVCVHSLKQNLHLLSQRRRPDGADSLSTPVGGPVMRPDHCKLLHLCQQPNQVEVVVLAPLFCFMLMRYKSASSADEDLSVAMLMRMQDPPPPASPSDCRELGRQINYEEVKAELEWGGRQHEGAGDISIFQNDLLGPNEDRCLVVDIRCTANIELQKNIMKEVGEAGGDHIPTQSAS
ncbi:uncharacterized protein LOC119316615 [Triticum dicoccoides]|uniref:uncharacterized protein LOC119316615 n=1 Tax=Triticum dicoccoides TaxID=85692 RepID=UPI001890BE72|nr:uncharacterized protein LOC119316615 [Triticum dicoccoides]XP_037446869.1 uncharacterized protein LOC119316615 [Triticum dicoccoides]XP_037446870.1 uncharacterized protein LOC119316615 [Triticum dicoccoides]XP_037446871.1 uncharacterized protein LOC119316615 [Triticum dicoccoides]